MRAGLRGTNPQLGVEELAARLVVMTSSVMASNAWFPPPDVLTGPVGERFPQARAVPIDPGPISRPDLVAGPVRGITAPLR